MSPPRLKAACRGLHGRLLLLSRCPAWADASSSPMAPGPLPPGQNGHEAIESLGYSNTRFAAWYDLRFMARRQDHRRCLVRGARAVLLAVVNTRQTHTTQGRVTVGSCQHPANTYHPGAYYCWQLSTPRKHMSLADILSVTMPPPVRPFVSAPPPNSYTLNVVQGLSEARFNSLLGCGLSALG